jgi:hypothetical protein
MARNGRTAQMSIARSRMRIPGILTPGVEAENPTILGFVGRRQTP